MRLPALILAATTSLWSAQAHALSCIPPDVARSFAWAESADETYIALLGQFDYVAPPRVEPRDINNPTPLTVTAQFSGQGLGANGFGVVADQEVTLITECFGPWCGGLPNAGVTTLAFVRRDATGLTLSTSPCGGQTFENPRAQDIRRVETCMKGGECTPNDGSF